MNDLKEVLVYLHSSITAKLYRTHPNVSPIVIADFWNKFLRLIQSDAYSKYIELGPLVFVINFDEQAETGSVNFLNKDNFEIFFKDNSIRANNVLYIDSIGNSFKINPFNSEKLNNTEDVSDASASNPNIFVFLKGNELTIFHKQILLKNIPDFFSLSRVGQIKGYLPISEYRKLIERHFDTEIKGERGLLYWKNKKDYELVAAPENKFRKKLANFLENNVSGGFIDEEALNDNSTDRNDIRVITVPDHKVYIIEIKWVGISEGSNYDGIVADQKANEGFEQLNLYINGESRCICGILVIYDARKNEAAFNWQKPMNTWSTIISNPPVVLSLDPTSSSDMAKKIVKNAK